MNFIVYQPDGEGCFLEFGTFTELQDAIANCPAGGHVERTTDSGSVTVYFKL